MLKRPLALLIAFALFASGFNLHISAESFQNADTKVLAKLYGTEKILICTSTGYKYISFAELADNIEAGKVHQGKKKCPTCLSTHYNKAFSIEASPAPAEIAYPYLESLKPPRGIFAVSFISLSYNARSPPSHIA